VCAGADPVVCTADQCHAAGTCNPATGLCAKPATNEGQPCDDGNACTRSDTCQTGSCAGADPVICTAVNQCHEVGTCTPATGVCSTPDLPDGTACDDGDACTQSQCREGQCAGKFGVGADIVCSAHSLLVAPCGADQVPKALQKFIEGKVNSARTLLQKADEAALKGGKEAKIKKLRTKVIKVLNKISKKAAKFVNASKPEQSISEACKGQIDSLVQQRQQLIGAFVF